MWPRRDVLRLGALIAAGGAIAPLLAACASPAGTEIASGAPSGSPGSAALSGTVTVLAEGSDPSTEPSLKRVYDDFKTQNPGIDWDIRAIPGLGPDWDRLARAALESGEPVGLVMLDGLFIRAWARDGLLADLDAEPRLAEVLASVPAQFHLGGPGEGGARALPLAVTRGVQTTGIYYNKALLDRAGLEPPKTIADLKAMVEPLAALGVSPLVHPAGDIAFNPLLVMWLLPMIAERTGDPIAFVESTVKGEVRYDSPEWIEAFETDRRSPRVGRPAGWVRRHGLRDHAAALPAGKGRHDLQRHVAPGGPTGGDAHRPFRPACGPASPRRWGIEGSLDPCLGGLRAAGQGRPRAVTASTHSWSSPVGPR